MAYLVPTLATLRAELNSAFPGRSKSYDGWIGDAAHAKTKSDHNPDAKGRVRAVDLTAEGARGAALAEVAIAALKARGQKGYVIHQGRIANPSVQGGAWRRYSGSNPHTHHVHVSAHTQLTSTARWGVVPLSPPRVSGILDRNTITLLQTLVGARVDGVMGKETIGKLQTLVGVEADGLMGPVTARAVEKYLGAPVEQIPGWYPGLIRALQRRLADLVNTGEL